MEIIDLESNQLISSCNLVKITIGQYEGKWALEAITVLTRGGKVCIRDESHEVRGDYYHESEFNWYKIVYDEYYQCYELKSNCHYGYISANSRGFFHVDTDYLLFEGDYYINSDIAEECGVFYCSGCETHYCLDYGCECYDEDEEENNYSSFCFEYHSDNREDFSRESVYKIGFEVEKEDYAVRDSILADELFDNTGWAKERDSSLGNGGFELVSPILPFDISIPINQQLEINNAINGVESHINAAYSDRCGGHINISKQGMVSQHLLESISGYLPLFYSIYQCRVNNTYAKAKSLKEYITKQEKHCSFHCKSDGVIEIRIFPAVKNVNNLLWRAELLRIMLTKPTNNYRTALVEIANPKNELHQHLIKVFDKQKLFNKVKLFVKYAAQFEDVQFKQKIINHNLGKIYKVA